MNSAYDLAVAVARGEAPEPDAAFIEYTETAAHHYGEPRYMPAGTYWSSGPWPPCVLVPATLDRRALSFWLGEEGDQ